MKIVSLHIYGYGKFDQVMIENLGGMNIFYGENEAGKSTIMSFIHSILFGFPTKQQTELRYEPKKGSKYGGQLVILFEQHGKTVVERVKGKATGDVSVLLEDGTRGGEELLKELLSYVDKSLYQSIFSFNLNGLQNVHQLKSEDIGKFLFSSGAVGTERLLTLDLLLQKELDSRFKPNGKKPYINEKLQELRDLQNELKKAEQHNSKYWDLNLEKEELLEQVEKAQQKLEALHKKVTKLEEWKKISPIVNEMEFLEQELKKFEGQSFPMDGMTRLNQLKQVLQPIEGHMKSLHERIERLRKELDEHRPCRKVIEKELEITSAIESYPLYESFLEEEKDLDSKLKKIDEEIGVLKDKLHAPTTNFEEWLSSNTSVFMKEKTLDAQKKQERLRDKKIELDEQFSQEKETLEKIETNIEELKRELLPEGEREQLEREVSAINSKGNIENELKNIQEKIAILRKTEQREKKHYKKQLIQNRVQTVLLSALLTVVMGWGLWVSEVMVTVFGGVGLLTIIVLYLRKNRQAENTELRDEIASMVHRERELIQHLNAISPNLALMEEKLRNDQEKTSRLKALEIRLSQQNDQYEKVISSYEKWEKDFIEHESFLLRLGEELNIPTELALNHLHDAFLIIDQLKSSARERQYVLEQMIKKQQVKQGIVEKLEQLGELILDKKPLSLSDTVFLLRKKVKEEIEKEVKYKEHEEMLRNSELELQGLHKECSHIQGELKSLFELALVKTEEEFRLAGRMEEKRSQLIEQIENLSLQVHLSSLTEAEKVEFGSIVDVVEELSVIHMHIEEYSQSVKKSQERVAEVKHEISVLEEGGKYTDLLHRYHQLKSEFNEEAKKWAKYAFAKNVLNQTIDYFKKKRLPTMLKKAEEYLIHLTDGNYTRIILKNEGHGLLVEGIDHSVFEANELSQATTEQLYVSLRLALATTIYHKYHLPIIIDDSFVNFDHIRAEKVIQLLKKVEGHQVLFFTCHKHLLAFFDHTEVIHLKEAAGSPIHFS